MNFLCIKGVIFLYNLALLANILIMNHLRGFVYSNKYSLVYILLHNS